MVWISSSAVPFAFCIPWNVELLMTNWSTDSILFSLQPTKYKWLMWTRHTFSISSFALCLQKFLQSPKKNQEEISDAVLWHLRSQTQTEGYGFLVRNTMLYSSWDCCWHSQETEWWWSNVAEGMVALVWCKMFHHAAVSLMHPTNKKTKWRLNMSSILTKLCSNQASYCTDKFYATCLSRIRENQRFLYPPESYRN